MRSTFHNRVIDIDQTEWTSIGETNVITLYHSDDNMKPLYVFCDHQNFYTKSISISSRLIIVDQKKINVDVMINVKKDSLE